MADYKKLGVGKSSPGDMFFKMLSWRCMQRKFGAMSALLLLLLLMSIVHAYCSMRCAMSDHVDIDDDIINLTLRIGYKTTSYATMLGLWLATGLANNLCSVCNWVSFLVTEATCYGSARVIFYRLFPERIILVNVRFYVTEIVDWRNFDKKRRR